MFKACSSAIYSPCRFVREIEVNRAYRWFWG
jgi:hypothetical protein